MAYVLAVDQGTTSSRALLIGHDGQVAGSAQKEFTQIFPRPGWVEHDPEEIWRVTLEVMRQVAGDVGQIAAIGITNQRETTVMWDRKTGRPVANAIVWQDRRTAGFCDDLKRAGHEELITHRVRTQELVVIPRLVAGGVRQCSRLDSRDLFVSHLVAQQLGLLPLHLLGGLMQPTHGKILVDGVVQAAVKKFLPNQKYLEAQLTINTTPLSMDSELDALLRHTSSLFAEYVHLNRNVPSEVLVAFENTRDPRRNVASPATTSSVVRILTATRSASVVHPLPLLRMPRLLARWTLRAGGPPGNPD